MYQNDYTAKNNNAQIIPFQLSLDRLTVCFNEPNIESVKKTCGLLISDHMSIKGIQASKNHRYEVSCIIPFPISGSGVRHNVCFEAGPRRSGQAAFRLDFNPSKFSQAAIFDLCG